VDAIARPRTTLAIHHLVLPATLGLVTSAHHATPVTIARRPNPCRPVPTATANKAHSSRPSAPLALAAPVKPRRSAHQMSFLSMERHSAWFMQPTQTPVLME
jgi:hypothetical protein